YCAENLIAEFIDNQTDIDVGFTGDKLTYFGVLDTPSDLVIIVTGPRKKIKALKKEKKMWLWINSKSKVFSDVPTYYFVASSKPLNQIRNDAFLKINQIGLENLRFQGAEEMEESIRIEWRDGIIQSMKKMGRYHSEHGKIEIIDGRLFKTDISFSSDISEGTYIVDTLVLKNSEVTGARRSFINVSKSGLGEKVYLFGTNNGLAYGIVAVIIAMFFGFLVNEITRKINA
ncbi:MAG: TIGR02186 family protein, partial [Pseudomonadota bacterium]|nr:TIGR02186 family protein [Pseudomonadota bacterium]